MKLRIRHIEGFRAVMQAGTATGAASLLNVTQPAISQLMTDMEAIVGFPLFDRRGGRLAPTANAEQLFDEVERCFTGLRHVSSFCNQMRKADGHAIVIATIPSMALALLPSAIGRYVKSVQPDFFTLYTRHSNDAVRLVGSQKADIGFGSRPINAPGIHCEKVSSHDVVCALPVDHPLTRKQAVTARDLRHQPFITLSHDEGVGEEVENMFRRQKVEVNAVATCPMTTAACALVENGVGIALVEHGAAAFFTDRRVALRRFTPSIRATFYAYWLEKATPRYRRPSFITIVKEEARRLELALDATIGA